MSQEVFLYHSVRSIIVNSVDTSYILVSFVNSFQFSLPFMGCPHFSEFHRIVHLLTHPILDRIASPGLHHSVLFVSSLILNSHSQSSPIFQLGVFSRS